MNFEEDLRSIILQELKRKGYFPKNKELRNVLRILLNIRDKTISMNKRTVHISKELQLKELEEPYAESLKVIQKKFEKGQNINPYLSKAAFKGEAKDLLLYDWGIHHLHLNLKYDKKGFIQRSDYLLFFMLKDSEVFFIDVTKHRIENRTEFAQQDLICILWRNWKELLLPFRLHEAISASPRLNDRDYLKARQAGSVVLMECDGNVFMPPGGGISTATTKIMHTRELDETLDLLKQVETNLRAQLEFINNELGDFNLAPIQADFQLIFTEEKLYVIERHRSNLIGEFNGGVVSAFTSLKNLHLE